jgi:hypothetical protein
MTVRKAHTSLLNKAHIDFFGKAPIIKFRQARANLIDDRGSLSILSTSLFFLIVVTSFVILNISSAMLAKRELIQIGESAITRATHNLNVSIYYAGASDGNGSVNFPGPAGGSAANGSASAANGSGSAANGSASAANGNSNVSALPINCNAAYQTFTQQLSLTNLRSNPIGFSEWSCDGFATSAKITSQANHLLRIPFMTANSTYTLSATISAHNRLQ